VIKKLIMSAILGCALIGCKTEYPPTQDDRGVVQPDSISNQKSKDGDPVLWDMPLWWK